MYRRVVLVGHTNGSAKSNEVLFLAAGVSMLFHRALAMFWWARREGWKQSSCGLDMSGYDVVVYSVMISMVSLHLTESLW